MNIKKFFLGIFLKLRENPIIGSFILTIGGAIFYFCGHLLIASYLLGTNFNFIEFVLDPLPIPYGHILAAGIFILVLISTSIFLAAYTVFLLENSEYTKTAALLLSLFVVVFMISNFYSLSTTSQLNYNGLIVLILGIFLCALIITFVYAALNLLLGLTTFFYGWNIFVLVAIYVPIIHSVYIGIIFALGLFILFWLLFLCMYYFKRNSKYRAITILLAFPYCFTLALVLVASSTLIIDLPTVANLLAIVIVTVALCILSLKWTKTIKNHIKFKTIFAEIKETGDHLNRLLASSLVSLILVLLLPSLVIYSGKAFNEFDNANISHTIVTESDNFEGRYLGLNNGLHYYIKDNKLYRTKDVVNILPK